MEKQVIKCEYCTGFTIVNAENYKAHLKKIHQIDLQKNFDHNSRIEADKHLVSEHLQKLRQKQLEQQQKNREKEYENQKRQEAAQKRAEERQRHRLERLKEKELELERQRQKFIEENTHNLNIIWDDIIFAKDCIKFDVKRLNFILKPVPCLGVFESLNTIKKEYFQRLYSKKIYKLSFLKGELIFEKSPGWMQILETIDFAKEFYEYRYLNLKAHGKTKRFAHLSNNEILSLFEKSFAKSDYLKFLASKQSEKYKIIPVMEFINNHTEESFLFRLLTKKRTALIVWENVNDARATHIFSSSEKSLEDTLGVVEEFICRQDIDTKRSFLYYSDTASKKLKERLHYLKCIKHTYLSEYKQEIEYLVEYL